MVLIAFRLTAAIGAVGIATGLSRAGLVRPRTVLILVLIAFRLTAAIGAVGVAARLTRASPLSLRAVGMLPAERLPVLQARLGLFAGLLQRLTRLAQGFLDCLTSPDPRLHQRLLLLLCHRL